MRCMTSLLISPEVRRWAGRSWSGLSLLLEDGRAKPLACQQGQLKGQPVLIKSMPEGLLGLADSILDTVLVEDEPLGGGLVAAVLLQEDPQGVAEPGVVVLVGGQRPERLDDPGLQELNRVRHQGQGCDLGEAGQARSRRSRGRRNGVCG